MHPHPLLSLLGAVLTGLGVLLLFSLAVFVHELGHYLAARWMGLTIDVFSLGFGPAIWKRKVGETEYRISTIPFAAMWPCRSLIPPACPPSRRSHGGGDAAEGAAGNEVDGEEPPPRLLKDIAPWRRIIVALAGPPGQHAPAVLLPGSFCLAPRRHRPGGGRGRSVARDSGAYRRRTAARRPDHERQWQRGPQLERVPRRGPPEWRHLERRVVPLPQRTPLALQLP